MSYDGVMMMLPPPLPPLFGMHIKIEVKIRDLIVKLKIFFFSFVYLLVKIDESAPPPPPKKTFQNDATCLFLPTYNSLILVLREKIPKH